MLNFTTLKNRSARGALTAIAWSVACCLLTPALAGAADYYAAPNGSSTNDGSLSRPLDLATALSASSPARAGDTIWLRDGTYVGNFVSELVGSPSAPIIVRQYPGERATIDANTSARTASALVVRGSDTWYWGFEVTDSNPVRMVTGGYNPPRGTSVWVLGARTKFINMTVHDGEQGFGFWDVAVDSELYGNLIYNVGFESDDRAHGHSIYVQNTTGTKKITDNILFNGYSFGIHAYTTGGHTDNIHMVGNTIFNHGVPSRISGPKANILMSGVDSRNPVVQDNLLYYSPFVSSGRNLDLKASCINGTVRGNYSAGGTAASIYCVGTTVTSNVFAGVFYTDISYPSNTYSTQRPIGTRVFVRPNTYEPGARANITVYNWDRQPYVLVDLSAVGLPAGAEFEIRDAQNYFGNPVVAGVYTGASVLIPMTGLTVDPPIGQIPMIPIHTAPDFGAFVLVRPAGAPAPTVPTASLVATPSSVNPGQSSMLTWSTSGATSVTINNGIGSVPLSGSASINPTVTTTYVLTASNAHGSVSRSATVTVTTVPAPPPGSPTARFVGVDTTAKGTWKGVFGSDGYSISGDGTSLPGWATLNMAGQPQWKWTGSTTDVRALQKVSSGRIASTWYSDTNFAIDVNVVDGQEHQVALYVLDWDKIGRSQSIDVVDPVTGVLLDRRTVSDFSQGQYLIWNVEGNVRFKLTRLASKNAVVSGVFFGGGTSTPAPNVPPIVTLTTSGTPTAPANLTLKATATDSDGIADVKFYSGAVLLGTDTTSPYSYAWTKVAAGTYSVTALATDKRGAATRSAAVNVIVSGQSSGAQASATFIRTDTTTRGNWRGPYGAEGYSLSMEGTSLPAYAQLSMATHSSWTWSSTTTDLRALQRSASTGRIAATWYSDSAFTMDLTITDGQRHRVALYAIDWDAIGRTQTIEVLDAATNAVLDTRTVTAFSQGQYWTWDVSGRVRIRIKKSVGQNAVISGVFFGAP